MASTAKLALKAHVADWLAELDACYEMREVWHPEKARVIEQRVLVHPPLAKHTGTLHRLIQADYSSLIPKSEMDEYRKKLEANGHRVPLERSSFQAGYRWAIIKKWDRWKKLRVVERIANYEKDVVTHWEQFWGLHGGAVSPYTREWIQYENLIDAHRCVFGEPDEKQYSRWDSQFPAVAVMRRIEGGEPSRGADIVVLEKWASPWCKEHVFAGANELIKRLSSLEIRRAELREEGIDRLWPAPGC